MNKQELIEKYESLKGIWNNPGSIPALECFLRDLHQLSEPQKVVIPRFVAEWIEECKVDDMQSLSSAISISAPEDVSNWLALDDCKNEDLFAQAWLDGYEVEQEKLYTVEIPDLNNSLWRHTFLKRQSNGKLRISLEDDEDWRKNNFNQLTEAEIKKDFEWAWNGLRRWRHNKKSKLAPASINIITIIISQGERERDFFSRN